MAMRTSQVSIIIPCFNQAHYLPSAIASAHQQTVAPLEIIVVDDGATDGTAAVAQGLGATVLRQANAGLSAARNAGLASAKGEFVVLLDADDELLPQALAVGAAVLASRPEASAAVGRCQAMDAEGRVLPVQHHSVQPADLYRQWLSKNFVWTPGAAMFRREALRASGGFPRGLDPVADYAVYLRLARTGTVVLHDAEVARYRQHDASMSRDPLLMLRMTLEVLRRERHAAPPQLAPEIRRGARAWRAWYGERIVQHLRRDWRAGRRGTRQGRELMALLRHAPALVWHHALRKSRSMAREVVAHGRSRSVP